MMPTAFPDDRLVASMTAQMLLEIKAVNFRADEPYKFTSGLASPVYIDCRKIISFLNVRNTLMDFAAAKIRRDVGFEQLDAVAGGETAGIPFAAWLSDRLNVPMLYVRKKPKGFGRDAQIEGYMKDGDRVLLVEDLTTDGGSKITFCDALRTAGGNVSHAVVVFYYDIFPESKVKLADHGVTLHYLATWWDVLTHCKENEYFDENTLTEVERFLNNPLEWSAANGGVSKISI